MGADLTRSSRPGLVTAREPGPDRVDVELTLRARAEEGFDGGKRDRGVVGLMLAVQGQENVGVHATEALQLQHLAADRDLAVQHGELGVLPGDRRVSVHALCEQHLHRRGRLAADDRDGVGRVQGVGLPLDDARLLGGDVGDVVTQVVGVVDADRRDDGDGRIDNIGGVPATAHADLDDRHVDRGVGERRERHRRHDLELAHGGPRFSQKPACDCLSTICTNGSTSRYTST